MSTVARVAGATILLYRGTGVISYFLYETALGRGSAEARLASAAAHASDLRLATVLTMVNALCALILAVALYFYTRSAGAEASTLGLIGRTAEAALYGVFALSLITLASIATSSTDASRAIDARLVIEIGWLAHRIAMAASFFFAAANAAFAWQLLRARLAPRFMAMLGLVGGLIPLGVLPLQMIDATRGFETELQWVTMFLFELLFSVWLLFSGGRTSEIKPVVTA